MVSASNLTREDRAEVSRRIRATMRARGWSSADLAARMRRSKSAVVNLVAGGNGSPGARLRLELALETAFWTDAARFAVAVKVAAFYQGDHPRTVNLRRLDALARVHLTGATDRGRIRPRAELLARLENHALSTSAATR